MEQSSSTAAAYPGGTQGSAAGGAPSPLRDALKEGGKGISDAASAAKESARTDMESLRQDLNSLSETVREFVSQASGEAGKAARSATGALVEQAGETGSKLASAVAGQAKTFASELEEMGRKHPLIAMGSAVVVGVLIGLMGRSRS